MYPRNRYPYGRDYHPPPFGRERISYPSYEEPHLPPPPLGGRMPPVPPRRTSFGRKRARSESPYLFQETPKKRKTSSSVDESENHVQIHEHIVDPRGKRPDYNQTHGEKLKIPTFSFQYIQNFSEFDFLSKFGKRPIFLIVRENDLKKIEEKFVKKIQQIFSFKVKKKENIAVVLFRNEKYVTEVLPFCSPTIIYDPSCYYFDRELRGNDKTPKESEKEIRKIFDVEIEITQSVPVRTTPIVKSPAKRIPEKYRYGDHPKSPKLVNEPKVEESRSTSRVLPALSPSPREKGSPEIPDSRPPPLTYSDQHPKTHRSLYFPPHDEFPEDDNTFEARESRRVMNMNIFHHHHHHHHHNRQSKFTPPYEDGEERQQEKMFSTENGGASPYSDTEEPDTQQPLKSVGEKDLEENKTQEEESVGEEDNEEENQAKQIEISNVEPPPSPPPPSTSLEDTEMKISTSDLVKVKSSILSPILSPMVKDGGSVSSPFPVKTVTNEREKEELKNDVEKKLLHKELDNLDINKLLFGDEKLKHGRRPPYVPKPGHKSRLPKKFEKSRKFPLKKSVKSIPETIAKEQPARVNFYENIDESREMIMEVTKLMKEKVINLCLKDAKRDCIQSVIKDFVNDMDFSAIGEKGEVFKETGRDDPNEDIFYQSPKKRKARPRRAKIRKKKGIPDLGMVLPPAPLPPKKKLYKKRILGQKSPIEKIEKGTPRRRRPRKKTKGKVNLRGYLEEPDSDLELLDVEEFDFNAFVDEISSGEEEEASEDEDEGEDQEEQTEKPPLLRDEKGEVLIRDEKELCEVIQREIRETGRINFDHIHGIDFDNIKVKGNCKEISLGESVVLKSKIKNYKQYGISSKMKNSINNLKFHGKTKRNLTRSKISLYSVNEMEDQEVSMLAKREKKLRFARSPIHEWGLFALEPIKKGEFVVEYIGEVVRSQVADIREKRFEKIGIGSSYLFRLDESYVVDATLKGNIARFINHSCDPNCSAKIVYINGKEPRVVIFALNDIDIGQEVTYDYKFPFEETKIPCFCGAINCKGTLN